MANLTKSLVMPNGQEYEFVGKHWYGTCSTAANSQTKNVSITGFTSADLVEGVQVTVRFTNAQGYNGTPWLNVSSTGAKPIAVQNEDAKQYEWGLGATLTFSYYSGSWCIINSGHAGTVGWGKTKLSNSIANDDTVALTPKAVYDAEYAGGVSLGGNAVRTNGILYGQVDGTSTKTVFTATITGVTEYYHGLSIMLRNGIVSSASGFTININGLGAKPVYSSMADASRDTTIFAAAYTMLFVYDENRVEDGCFVCYRGYNSDTNTIAYVMRLNSSSLPVTGDCYRYRLLFTSADGTQFVPSNTSNSTNGTAARAVNQTPINPLGEIFYYNSTSAVTSGSRPGASALCYSYQHVLGYAFNVNGNETLTAWKPCYLKCAPQSDGSAIMDASTPIVQDLPTTEDGKIYIFLGIAYDTTHMELHIGHPVYHYKDGQVRLWTTASIPTKTSDLTNDSGYITGMYIASYGNSTYADILAAYQANKVVYCRASSNANPGTGNQNRMAFLAYVNDPTTPTEFEFQYYRSVATHSDSQQGDQVFVYKVNSSGTWAVTTREAYTKIVAGTGLTSSYNNGTLTISLA